MTVPNETTMVAASHGMKGKKRNNRYRFLLILVVVVMFIHSLSSNFQIVSIQAEKLILPITSTEESVKGNVTIFLDLRMGWLDWGFSFFEAKQLQRYGQAQYDMKRIDFTNESKELERIATNVNNQAAACILASNPNRDLEEIRNRHAPNCKTWIINDEYCRYQGNLRHYYKENNNNNSVNEIFVPLGPRHDFDKAYHEQRRDKTILIQTSDRPLKFNAIFTKSTSPSRKTLKQLLQENPKFNSSSMSSSQQQEQQNPPEYFIQIAWRWRRNMGPLHVNSTRYVSQSQFTLAPIGHDPECFRFWESIIMGSIPIMVIDDEYMNHECPNALYPIWESILRDTTTDIPTEAANEPIEYLDILQKHAPFIILQNWTLLESTLDRLYKEGNQALNERQQRLFQWYDDFMKEQVWKIEDYLFRNN